MTETQAKSGAAGADTESTSGSARPRTEPAQEPTEADARSAEGATGDAAEPQSSTTVIKRPGVTTSGGSSVGEPTREAGRDSRDAADEKADSGSSPYRAAGPSVSPSPVAESSPTTRLSPAEAAARAESTARTAPGSRVGSTPPSGSVRSPGASPVGRAPVVPGSASRGRTAGGSTKEDTSPVRGAAGAVTAAAAVGAARVSETLRTARATVAGAASRGPRRARLHLKRIDPWSVMKFSFAVSLVLFVVAIVATSVLYLALDAMGVFDSLNKTVSDITGNSAGEATTFQITAKGVIGTAVLLGAVNMVLFTALATLGAFVYNVCADLVGGVELTLSEKE